MHVQDYYRLKGNKSITRPDEIQDNFEQMMDIQIDKLQSYRAQTEDYRNNCISGTYVCVFNEEVWHNY